MLLLLAVYKLHKKVAHCAGYNVAKWYCRSDRHKRKVSILPFPSRYSPTWLGSCVGVCVCVCVHSSPSYGYHPYWEFLEESHDIVEYGTWYFLESPPTKQHASTYIYHWYLTVAQTLQDSLSERKLFSTRTSGGSQSSSRLKTTISELQPYFRLVPTTLLTSHCIIGPTLRASRKYYTRPAEQAGNCTLHKLWIIPVGKEAVFQPRKWKFFQDIMYMYVAHKKTLSN